MSGLPRFSPQQRAAMMEEEQKPMSKAEFLARCNAPLTTDERADFLALVAWFTRRYPTAGERLAATRHLMGQWTQHVNV
jgi:hypothetical protein